MAQAARECGVRLRLGEQRLLLLGTPIVDVWIASPPPTPCDGFWARVVTLLCPPPPPPPQRRQTPRGVWFDMTVMGSGAYLEGPAKGSPRGGAGA